MPKVTTFKAVTLTTIILVAVLVSLLFVFVIGGGDGGRKLGSIPLPGIKLASAAQANVLAQTLALDTSTAGMMAHLDLDIDGLNPLGLSSGEGTSPGFLSSVKERLVGTNGIASVQDFGDNFIIARWCVPNRVNCVNINLYVDSAGHIAAYLGPLSLRHGYGKPKPWPSPTPPSRTLTLTTSWLAAPSPSPRAVSRRCWTQ